MADLTGNRPCGFKHGDPLPDERGNIGELTIQGLRVRAQPDASVESRLLALEAALEALVLELVEVGSLPPEPPQAPKGGSRI